MCCKQLLVEKKDWWTEDELSPLFLGIVMKFWVLKSVCDKYDKRVCELTLWCDLFSGLTVSMFYSGIDVLAYWVVSMAYLVKTVVFMLE